MANAITCIRIICAIGLIFVPMFSRLFYLLYFLGGISDILDGFAARHFGKETQLGVKLDTVADMVFTAVVLIKVLKNIRIPLWVIIWTACIAVIKLINIVSGIVKSGHFVSEHTVLNKICGFLLFAIPICLGYFPMQQATILIIITCLAATVAAIQEGRYILSGKEVR